jgi:hypothetical protein
VYQALSYYCTRLLLRACAHMRAHA